MDEILDTYEAASCFDKVQKAKGRPKLKLNATGIAVIEALARVHCTEEEIAGCLRVTVETLHNDLNKEIFSECIKKGTNDGRMSLRRSQFRLAQESATMAIWLGKQLLGQSDHPEHSGEDAEPITVTISFEDTSK